MNPGVLMLMMLGDWIALSFIGYWLFRQPFKKLWHRWFTELGRVQAERIALGARLQRIQERAAAAREVKHLRDLIAADTKRLAEVAFEKPEHFE